MIGYYHSKFSWTYHDSAKHQERNLGKLTFQSGYLVGVVLALAALTQVCFFPAKWPEGLEPGVNPASPGTTKASTFVFLEV